MLVGFAAALLVWVTVDVLRGGPWTRLDHTVSDQLRRTGVRAADWPQPSFWVKPVAYAVAELGAWPPVFAVLVPFVAGLAWRRGSWRPVFLLGATVCLLAAVVYAGKVGVGRMPPVHDALHSPVGRSYPSGHVPTAVLGWGLAAWLAADYRVPAWLGRALAVLGWAVPLLVCAAMLVLDYHWLSDLVAGLAVGVLLLRVLHWIDRVTLRHWPGERDGGAGRGGARRRVRVPARPRAGNSIRATGGGAPADPAGC